MITQTQGWGYASDGTMDLLLQTLTLNRKVHPPVQGVAIGSPLWFEGSHLGPPSTRA
jgi:hypothetical protein